MLFYIQYSRMATGRVIHMPGAPNTMLDDFSRKMDGFILQEVQQVFFRCQWQFLSQAATHIILIFYTLLQRGFVLSILPYTGQFFKWAPGRKPMLSKNSFTISPPVKRNVFLNNFTHSSLGLGWWAFSHFWNEPWFWLSRTMVFAFSIAAFIFRRLRIMPASFNSLSHLA